MAFGRVGIVVGLAVAAVCVTIAFVSLRMAYDGLESDERLAANIDELHSTVTQDIESRLGFVHDRLEVLSEQILEVERAQRALRARIDELADQGGEQLKEPEDGQRSGAGSVTYATFLSSEQLSSHDYSRIDKRAVVFHFDQGGYLLGLNVFTEVGFPLEVTLGKATLVEDLMNVELDLRDAWSEAAEGKVNAGEFEFFEDLASKEAKQYLKSLGSREIKQLDSGGHAIIDMGDWDESESVKSLRKRKGELLIDLGASDSLLWALPPSS